ncbi:chronophin-like [Stegostoma tigrinum]|uniref:chronophin-like n=1 Tax=Stegostoma tigrinum TaxID=3053191 RepID=UPI00202B9D74|nr:chronophin-like [Stegostoma tigrinum]
MAAVAGRAGLAPARSCCRRLGCESGARELLLGAVDSFVLDCDGVLWRGRDGVLSGAAELLGRLQALGKRVYLLSNNGSCTAGGLLDKCRRLGLPVRTRQLLNTARCSALYLRQALAPSPAPNPDPAPAPAVYVLGSPGLRSEVAAVGLRALGGGEQEEEEEVAASSTGVRAVLVGYDEGFSFGRLSRACGFLRDPRCLFVATDPDPWHPREGGRVVPGTGSLTAALEVASGRKAAVVGKPGRFMFDCIASEGGEGAVDPSRALMVGDRLETDILFGANCGMWTVLALTGVSSLQDVHAKMASELPQHKKMVPDFYVDSVADFLPLLSG